MRLAFILTSLAIFEHVLEFDPQSPYTKILITPKEVMLYIIWKVLTSWSIFKQEVGAPNFVTRLQYTKFSRTI